MASMLDGVNRLTQLVGRNRLELLMFRLGGKQRFGINVFKVREVIKCPALTKVPQSNPIICGIANMRGKTITVIDLSAAVGRAPLPGDAENLVIVTEYNRKVQGFLVRGVDRIINKNWEEINAPPKGMGRYTYLTAVTRVDDELVEIIDVERVLAEVMGMKSYVNDDAAGDQIAQSGGEAHHVLFADDSLVARKQVKQVLDKLGVSYTIAENGRIAWDILQGLASEEGVSIKEKVSMVISDIEMPEMDGYTLTKRIKEHPVLRDLYVCLHTSLSGNFNEAMVTRVGANRLLAKFDPEELKEVVSQVLKLAPPLAA